MPLIYHHSRKYLVKVPRDSAHRRKLHRTEVPWRPSWPQCTRAGILIHWATSRKSHTPTRIDGHHPCPKACTWVLAHIYVYIWYMLQYQFSCSVCPTLCDPMGCSVARFPCPFPWPCPPQSLLKLMPVELVRPCSHLLLCGPLLLLPSIFPRTSFFLWVASHQVARVVEFQLQH